MSTDVSWVKFCVLSYYIDCPSSPTLLCSSPLWQGNLTLWLPPSSRQCQLCDYWASRKIYLDKHYLKHRVIYCCTVCDEKFLSTIKLTQHLREKHGDGESASIEKLLEECINRSLNHSIFSLFDYLFFKLIVLILLLLIVFLFSFTCFNVFELKVCFVNGN